MYKKLVVIKYIKKKGKRSVDIGTRRTLKGLLIVVATKNPETMIEDYCKRWAIETLFGCLKSRGFDLESTHMSDLDRIDKLMGILALAFAWCLIVGHLKYGELVFSSHSTGPLRSI